MIFFVLMVRAMLPRIPITAKIINIMKILSNPAATLPAASALLSQVPMKVGRMASGRKIMKEINPVARAVIPVGIPACPMRLQ